MRFLCGLFVVALASLGFTSAHDGDKPQERELTVVKADKNETTLKKWTVASGTRRLSWESPAAKGKELKGPEYLEFRESSSPPYKIGITTYVPFDSISRVGYNPEKSTMSVTVKIAGDKEAVLVGPTEYVGINKLVLEGKIDLGAAGVASSRYAGGDKAKPAITAFRFSKSEPVPELRGPSMVIVGKDEAKTAHKVRDIKALYRVNGGERLSKLLKFKDTVKVDLSTVVKLHRDGTDDYDVTLPDNKSFRLSLIDDILPDDDKTAAKLIGLLVRVPAGYKLFPMHTFTELRKDVVDTDSPQE